MADLDALRRLLANHDSDGLGRESDVAMISIGQLRFILAASERIPELERERAEFAGKVLEQRVALERAAWVEAAARRIVSRVRVGADLDPLVADLQAALANAPYLSGTGTAPNRIGVEEALRRADAPAEERDVLRELVEESERLGLYDDDLLDDLCECGHQRRLHALRSMGHFDCEQCRCDKFDLPTPELEGK